MQLKLVYYLSINFSCNYSCKLYRIDSCAVFTLIGYLSPSVRFGAGPKTIVASILGYFIGKISYQTKCVEKIMNLPNSPLADVLRKQKGKLGFQETLVVHIYTYSY